MSRPSRTPAASAGLGGRPRIRRRHLPRPDGREPARRDRPSHARRIHDAIRALEHRLIRAEDSARAASGLALRHRGGTHTSAQPWEEGMTVVILGLVLLIIGLVASDPDPHHDRCDPARRRADPQPRPGRRHPSQGLLTDDSAPDPGEVRGPSCRGASRRRSAPASGSARRARRRPRRRGRSPASTCRITPMPGSLVSTRSIFSAASVGAVGDARPGRRGSSGPCRRRRRGGSRPRTRRRRC